MENVVEAIGNITTKIADSIGSNCIISIEQKEKLEEYFEENPFMNVLVTIFKKIKKDEYSKAFYDAKLNKLSYGSIIPIKEVLMEAINKKYIDKGDKVVCVVDESVGMGYKSLMFIFEVDKIFFNISTQKLDENIGGGLVEAVINIALELGREGREGKKIGTAFIIGDKSEILKHTKQLIINPFLGHSEELRKITNPEIKETIKEFAQLDGVFIIDKDGTIVSTGSYINIDSNVELPSGLGTRHLACASLTKETNSIAVVVSESGGVVRVFKEGKLKLRLP